jgi:hypothetical protein
LPPPPPVHVEAQNVIEQVVPRRDLREDPPDIRQLLRPTCRCALCFVWLDVWRHLPNWHGAKAGARADDGEVSELVCL